MARSVGVDPDRLPQVRQALERNEFLTQGELATHLGLSLSRISNLLNGKSLSLSTFDQICKALDLDRSSLIMTANNPSESERNEIQDQDL